MFCSYIHKLLRKSSQDRDPPKHIKLLQDISMLNFGVPNLTTKKWTFAKIAKQKIYDNIAYVTTFSKLQK